MSTKNRIERLEALVSPRPQRPAVHAIMCGPDQDEGEELQKYLDSTEPKARARNTVMVCHNLQIKGKP